MAKFELPIYGANDEIEKTHTTEIVRFGVLLQALEIEEDFNDMTVAEQFNIVSDFMKEIFPTLTADELKKADMNDVFNTFKQMVNMANKIGGKSKNAQRTAAGK